MPPQTNNTVVTPLHEIQGSGSVSPMLGQTVTAQGIVTGDFQNGDADAQNNISGFYLQEENPDGDPATSDGVFVFDGATPLVDVNAGDRVIVEGTVNEYFSETQISAARVEVITASAGFISETDVNLPATATVINSDGDSIADLEQFEGMYVRFPQSLTVTQLYNLERYGEMLLSEGGRLSIFTNDNVPDAARYAAHLDQVATRSIMLDDGLAIQNADPVRYLNHAAFGPAPYPAIRIGDTTQSLTGNIRFSRGSGGSGIETYRLVPTIEPSFRSVNTRPGT